MTTPAALALALPAAAATSSTELAASLAMVATSSSNAIKPDGIEIPCESGVGAPLGNLHEPRNSRIAPAMLAMDFIKANRATVEKAIRDKGVDLDLDALLALDGESRSLKTEIDNLRAERNAISAQFPKAAPE